MYVRTSVAPVTGLTVTCAGPSITTCLMGSGDDAGSTSDAVSTARGGAVGVGVGVGVPLVTVSAHVLLVSLLSGTALPGSTEQLPPARGFAYVPAVVVIAENDTSKESPGPNVTPGAAAVQVRSSLVLLIVQLTSAGLIVAELGDGEL